MSISRRGFLGGLAAGAATTALAKTAEANPATHTFPGYPGRYGLLHDTTLCVGCRSCEVACSEVNHNPPPAAPVDDKSVFATKRHNDDKLYTVVNEYVPATETAPAVYRKSQCMHCNEPCCASVCFVGAFTKTPEGPVLYNPDLCVGCRYCVMACPYYALAYEYENPVTPKVVRCTMCYPRIKEGKNPACADACPNGAITFGEREQLIEIARDRIRKHPDRYIDHIFGEHEFGGTSWMVLAGVEFEKLGLPENAPPTPLPQLTEGALSFVPLIVSAWPGLLLGMYAFNKRRDKLSKEALDSAVAETRAAGEAELKSKLQAATEKAKKDKEKAVAQAVKKTQAEAAKAAEAAARPAPETEK